MAVKDLEESFDLSERRACKILGFERSTHRYQKRPNDDAVVIGRMKEIVREWPRFGCPRVHILLRKSGIVKNHKRTERLYRVAKLQLKLRKRRRRVFKPETPLPPVFSANTRWSMDFVHDSLHDGRTFRVLTIIEEFSREAPHLEIDFSLSGQRVVRVLERLKATRGLPKQIGIDQGSEFTSIAVQKWALDNGVTLTFAKPGDKNENAFIESFNGKLRDECLNSHWFTGITDAREKIEEWRHRYNHLRPHRSLGGLTPTEYAKCRGLRICV